MALVALALPLDLEDRMSSELLRHGHDVVARCSSADELASIVSSARAAFAMVAASPRYLNDRLLTESDAAGVRIVALAATEDGRRHAAALDLREVIDAGAPWSEIERLMLGAAQAGGDEAAGGRGQVLAIWGPAGSPGRTTLAIALAAELAAEGHTVALADVDTHSGSVAPALGLLDEAPGFAAACRLAGADSLSRPDLERIGQRYLSPRGSFWVLTGIGRPSRWPELSTDRVVTTIKACRDWVDFTVVDTGFSLENDEEISSDLFAPRRNAATIAALREADHVIAVGSADPVGLSRFLRAHVDLVETIVTDRVTVVMNKIRASAIGLNASAEVRQTLQRFGGITSPVLVPYDRAALDGAILSGRTLSDVAPKSAARLAIRQFARERVLQQPVEARHGSGRLDSAAG